MTPPMRIVMFYHSLLSDWNHGNAHFLRGVVAELQARGHVVSVFEREDAWSASNLRADHGVAALDETLQAYPELLIWQYSSALLNLEAALDGVDLVLVHEWNDPALVKRVGQLRRDRRFVLLFHDTHHRSVSAVHEMEAYDLRDYDGVLAFGEAIRHRYVERGWASRAWTW